MKFRTDSDGFVTGVRFFKGGPTNSGTHLGRLWTSTGTLLASATFVGETSSGWQQVEFAHPVAVTAGDTYVASYYAPNGGYSYTGPNYFVTAWTRGPLTALADGTDGGNGVFRCCSRGWVPVDHVQPGQQLLGRRRLRHCRCRRRRAATVSDRAPAADAVDVSSQPTVRASFSEPVVESSIAFDVRPVGGTPVDVTSSYDAASRTVTLELTDPLAASTVHERAPLGRAGCRWQPRWRL